MTDRQSVFILNCMDRMTSDHIRHVDTRFGAIAYRERGSGPVALFVHGVFMNGYLWRHVVERVASVRRCIAIDLLAHGATQTADDADLSFDAQADMLAEFCERLDTGPIDLVANDSGVAIAQIFAVRYTDRVRTLTLTNGDVHDNWPPPAFARFAEAAGKGALRVLGPQMLADLDVARTRMGTGFEHPEAVSDQTLRAYLEPLYSTPERIRTLERWFGPDHDNRQTVRIEPLLRALNVPTLIVWATDDVFFDPTWARWLHDTIPGARPIVELAGAKLFFPEERPAELADALLDHWTASERASTP